MIIKMLNGLLILKAMFFSIRAGWDRLPVTSFQQMTADGLLNPACR